MRRKPTGVPTYESNIYSSEAIVNPYPHYQRLRDLGPVVWLPKQKVYALPRYSKCKAVLRDDKTLLSGAGVALNRITNRLSRGTTLNSDGAEHDQRRKHLAHRMLPRALRAISESVDATAAAVVDAAVSKGEIEGVNDIAAALPLAVVPDLIGRPQDQRDHLIEWGGATFDVVGPLNWQAIKAMPGALRMLSFARRIVRERTVLKGSMAHELLIAADEGKLSISASATGPMPAPVKPWPAWKRLPSCAHSSNGSTASKSSAHPYGRSTTSFAAMSACLSS